MNDRILVVDDEPDICEFLKRKLERTGYSVKVAQNGQEGLGFAAHEDFELIATDIVMPDMNGLQLFKELKKNPKTTHIPIIVFSAKLDVEDRCRELGIDNFMSKPFDGEVLVEKITDIIHQSSTRRKIQKILITQNDNVLLQDIMHQLNEYGWIIDIDVEVFESTADIVSRASHKESKIIMIDILKKDGSAADLIKILRDQSCEDIILTYTTLNNEDLLDPTTYEQLAREQNVCMTVGANEHIGQLNKFSFVLLMYEYC